MLASRQHRSHVVGLIGAGIGSSRSPLLHESEAAMQGINYVYKLVDLERLDAAATLLPRLLEAMEMTGFTGTNVTHPCKQAVIAHLDELSPEAEAIGAVNTVIFGGGRRVGHNTDCWGFAESFRRGLPDVRKDVVLQIGAGGAGAAVGLAALESGVGTLRLVDVNRRRAAALAERLSQRFGDRVRIADDPASSLHDVDGLINATPVGMNGHPGTPLDPDLLRAGMWVTDVVYVPLETELLRAARERGCRVLDGGGMAVFQAARAFQLFTGLEPDTERMLRQFAAA
jgi:shikimate dehydrogenase